MCDAVFSASQLVLRDATLRLLKRVRGGRNGQLNTEHAPIAVPLYQQLHKDSRVPRVRLLRLLPADKDHDPVRCVVETVVLKDCPPYEALSYCWGDTKQKSTITCNGQDLGVTPNLLSALQQLRGRDKPRTLWIDAICINQDDLAERSSQVLLIRSIFKKARRVLIWLGPAAADSHLAFRVLRRYRDLYPDLEKRFTEDPLSVINFGPLEKFLRRLQLQHGENVPSVTKYDDTRLRLKKKELVALRGILERRFWTRSWVVQEVCVGKELLVVCGHETMSGDDFRHGCVAALSVGGLFMDTGLPVWLECCFALAQLRDEFQGSSSQYMDKVSERNKETSARDRKTLSAGAHMRKVLGLSFMFNCSDEHDKIYSALGLIKPKPSIVPDYELPIEQCYQEAMMTMLTDMENLDAFSTFVDNFLRRSHKKLPTWVPDFSNTFTGWDMRAWGSANPYKEHLALATLLVGVLDGLGLRKSKHEFSASGRDGYCHPRVEQRSVLVLEGFEADSIAAMGSSLTRAFECDKNESWQSVARAKGELSSMQRYRYFIQRCLRTMNWVDVIMTWEDLIMEDPIHPTKAERAAFCRVIEMAPSDLDMTFSMDIYEEAWGRLLRLLRRISPLKALDVRCGGVPVYDIVAGSIAYLAITRSQVKAHLVPFVSAEAEGFKVAKTAMGRLAYVPSHTRTHDRILLLRGGKTPFVARPYGDKWEFVGNCYVDGIMLGERWKPEEVRDIEFV